VVNSGEELSFSELTYGADETNLNHSEPLRFIAQSAVVIQLIAAAIRWPPLKCPEAMACLSMAKPILDEALWAVLASRHLHVGFDLRRQTLGLERSCNHVRANAGVKAPIGLSLGVADFRR
jgi:hypothetical protein